MRAKNSEHLSRRERSDRIERCDPGEGYSLTECCGPSPGLLRNPTSPRWGEVETRAMAKQAERRAATSEAILTAARRLFGTQGFAATTMDEIAEGARVAKGAVYHHFKTKEAVFEAVFDLVSRDLVAEIDSTARAEKDVLA